jgi:hypothetical protein
MKRVLLILSLLVSAAAFAQTPPADASGAEADMADPARPCVSGEESGPLEDGELPDGAAREPCQEPETDTAPAAGEELADVVEEDPFIEASADEVFEPGDEISEDYPVPLPSDI